MVGGGREGSFKYLTAYRPTHAPIQYSTHSRPHMPIYIYLHTASQASPWCPELQQPYPARLQKRAFAI